MPEVRGGVSEGTGTRHGVREGWSLLLPVARQAEMVKCLLEVDRGVQQSGMLKPQGT